MLSWPALPSIDASQSLSGVGAEAMRSCVPRSRRLSPGVALAIAAGATLATWTTYLEKPSGRPLDVPAIVVLVAATGSLLLRRRAPVLTVALTVLCTIAWYAGRYAGGPPKVALFVALYTLAAQRETRTVALVGAGVLMVGLSVIVVFAGSSTVEIATGAVAWVVASLSLGAMVRGRRALEGELLGRLSAAEHARAADVRRHEAESRKRLADERLRIARDLHDIMAHTIAVIGVQAGVVSDLVEEDPAAVQAAMSAIRQATRDATAELGATFAVLRGEDAASARSGSSTIPAPGIDQLRTLVSSVQSPGLAVELVVAGTPRLVSAIQGLTVHRLVQEALANVVRHACATLAVVTIWYDATSLSVEVVDNGVGRGEALSGSPSAERRGFGIRGMQERVEALDGTFAAGPRLEGRGWSVSAWLPLTVDEP